MTKSEGLIILFLGALTAISCISMDFYIPGLPEVQADFGISPSMAQLSLTAVMIGMALWQLWAGPFSDKIGRKKPLVAGMFIYALTSLGCALAPTIGILIFMRFIEGLSGAFGLVLARAIARDLRSGPALLRLYSLLMLVNGIAPIVAPVLGGWLLQWTSWRGAFYVLTMIGIALTLSCLFFKESLPKDKRISQMGQAFKAFGQLMKNSYFLGQCLISGFVFVSFFAYIAGSSFVLEGSYHLTPQQYSYVMGVIGLGLLAAGLIPAKLANTVREEMLLGASIAVSLIGSIGLCSAFLLSLPLPVVLVFLFITTTPLSITETVSLAMALSRCKKNAGAASALIGFFTVAFGGAAMPISGIGGGMGGLPMAFLMLFGYAVCAIVFAGMIRGK